MCADGHCSNTAVADDTECDDDLNSCTRDVCVAGACTHPDKEMGASCDDEPNPATEDKCCGDACTHYPSGALAVSYAATLYDPQNQRGDVNKDGKIDDADRCPIGSLSASLTGPSPGADAGGAVVTFTVTMTFYVDGDPAVPAACTQLEGRDIAQALANMTPPIEGYSYNPATGTATITRESLLCCESAPIDLTLDMSGPSFANNVFFLSADVDVGVDDCCYVSSISGTIGELIFHEE